MLCGRCYKYVGVERKLAKAVMTFYHGNKVSCAKRSEKGEWFHVKVGLQQGCMMLPWLFNLFMDRVMRDVNAWGKGVRGKVSFAVC